jgi:oligopeptide transport system ATP-binding protein
VTEDGTAGPILDVRHLTTRFRTRRGLVRAVEDVSWSVSAGESIAIVGESGSGKSVSALSLLGLVPPPGEVTGGEVFLGGRDVLGLSSREWSRVRGREIAMVFQDPMTSLNPVLTVGYQMAEGLKRHLRLSGADARVESLRLLDLVGIPDASRRLTSYPHELSGGQRQRVMIALALSCRPDVLIADEPTTALDVTIQDQIVRLVQDLQSEMGMAIVWITHDLALAAGMVDRVLVMYAGSIVESASVAELFARPLHPYTAGLLQSMPSLDSRERSRLHTIEGRPPDLAAEITGCPFAPRCERRVERCDVERPALEGAGDTRSVACWRSGQS